MPFRELILAAVKPLVPYPHFSFSTNCPAQRHRRRALLVSLAVTDRHLEAEIGFFEVLDVERHEFGSPESAGEAAGTGLL